MIALQGAIMLLMKIRVASATDRERVVRTVVSAFELDPAFRYFFPDDGNYVESASVFVGYLFDKRVGFDTVWVADDCSAASLWSPPDHMLTDESRARNFDLERSMQHVIGLEATARLDAYNSAVDGVLPSQPFWYLGILAVHPDSAGRGLGLAVMNAGIEFVRSNRGMAILETTNERNPEYYRRSGWHILNKIETTTPSTLWIMGNEPTENSSL